MDIRQAIAAIVLPALAACESVLPPAAVATPAATLVVVLDRSDSLATAGAARCASAVARVAERLGTGEAAADLLVLGTGAPPGYAPEVLVPWTRVAAEAELFGRPDQAASRLRQRLGEIAGQCRAAFAPCRASALYAGAAGGVAALRARCAGRACARPTLAMHSDFLDNVHPGLRRRLERAARGDGDLPAIDALDTRGLEVHLCGTGQGRGDGASVRRPGAMPPNALLRAWGGVFGPATPPAIDPSCP